MNALVLLLTGLALGIFLIASVVGFGVLVSLIFPFTPFWLCIVFGILSYCFLVTIIIKLIAYDVIPNDKGED